MRVRELDGIRGLAVLMVVFYHSSIWALPAAAFQGPRWHYLKWLVQVSRVGWLGVDLFFVLSGFLITSILLTVRTSSRYYRTFYMRRVLRIVPLYYLILAILWCTFKHSASYISLAAISLANLAPLLGVAVVYNPLWSLCVEEHFYLIWPAVIRKVKISYVLWICVSICALEPLARFVGWLAGTDTSYVTWFRLEGLASGALLATLAFRYGNSSQQFFRWGKYFLCSGAAILLAGVPFGILARGRAVNVAFGVTYADFLFAALVSFVLSRRSTLLQRILLMDGLVLCGDVSYCLYLIHTLIFWSWDRIVAGWQTIAHIPVVPQALLRLVVCCGVALGLAILSRLWFELPILSLKDRFEYDGQAKVVLPDAGPVLATEDDMVSPPNAALPT